MLVETVALSTLVLVLDLSQRCWIMLQQSFLKNLWLVNQAGLLAELSFIFLGKCPT